MNKIVILSISALMVAMALSGCGTKSTTSTEPTCDPAVNDACKPPADKGAVKGLLIDDVYRPIPNALVLLQEAGMTTTTNAEGEFSFVDVDPGAYTIKVSAENHEAARNTVQVNKGEIAEIHVSARRILSSNGNIQSTEFSVFVPCAVSSPAISIVYGCFDNSGDSYRPGIEGIDLTKTANITWLITEAKVSRTGYFDLVVREDDGSTGGGVEYGDTATNGTNYAKVIMKMDSAYQKGEGNWTNDKLLAALVFYLGETEKPCAPVPGHPGAGPVAPTNDTERCTFSAGAAVAYRADIIMSAFIGDAKDANGNVVDPLTFCLLCDKQ